MRRPSGGPDLLFSLFAIAAEIRRANYLSCGVFLPRGEHQVRFRYRPRSFLICISLAFLLAASAAIPVLRSSGTDAQPALAWRIYEQ